MANNRTHYTIDLENEIVKAIIEKLTDKELEVIKKYKDLGFKLIPLPKPKKKKLSEEEKAKNPYSEKNIQQFLRKNGTKEQLDKYFEIYNQQAKDKKTGIPSVYKTDSKNGKFKKGDPKVKGHIATLQWFNNEFPNYKEEYK